MNRTRTQSQTQTLKEINNRMEIYNLLMKVAKKIREERKRTH